MAKCELEIVLDRSDDVFVPGEQVTGRVEVRVDAPCTTRGLKLIREWRTHGRGNNTSGGKEELVLFQGSWSPGQVYTHPFSFPAPAGPFTYHGHMLYVDWYLRAQADIPRSSDPKVERELLVVPNARAPRPEPLLGRAYSSLPQMLEQIKTSETARQELRRTQQEAIGRFRRAYGGKISGPTIGWKFALGILVVGLVFLAAGVWSTGFGLETVFGVIVTAIGAWMFYNALGNPIAERALGAVHAEVTPAQARPGDTLTCRVSFMPRNPVEHKGVTATLVARERVVSGSGTDRSEHTKDVYTAPVTLEEPRRVAGGEPVELQTPVAVPVDAACSFSAPDNQLSWLVNVRIRRANGPDWSSDYPVVVQP